MSSLASVFSSPNVKLPDQTPATRLPDAQDPAIKEAGARQRQIEANRQGRESTDLIKPGTGTGTPKTFANATLGS